MPEPLILCENLVQIYSLAGVEIVALQGLDLSVQEGELLGVIGASGSGKTTLLNVLGGLDRPSAGRVLVGGQDLLKMSDAQLDDYRCGRVGFVWQQPGRNLIPYLTAQENVELPMRLANRPSAERRQRAGELLAALGLSARARHLPAQLSGGEQQRAAIAVALANQPRLLLADEPTGEVDSATALEIYTALRKLNETYGMTTLIVSHDLNISRHTHRVVAIRDGKTSTETVRTVRRAAIAAPPGHAPERPAPESSTPPAADGHEFEELVVLDSAGRLQIPRDYLEKLAIGDRVRLELRAGEIAIRPVAGRERSAAPVEQLPAVADLYLDADPEPESRRPGGWQRARQALASLRPRRRPAPPQVER
jgi:ABC-type lipoprotein export system ATPase subunit